MVRIFYLEVMLCILDYEQPLRGSLEILRLIIFQNGDREI